MFSLTWQIYREPWVLLGGPRALLLQVAHPAVADGVARYSRFQEDPFGRGYRTFKAMATLYFGTREQAEATSRRLNRVHAGIKGTDYTATDPELQLWVFSTLVDTTLRVFEGMPLRQLPLNWKELFYEESKLAAALLGIPKEIYPTDLHAFESYFQAMLHGELLGSENVCREVAQAILQHPNTPKKAAYWLSSVGIPEPLCARLDIPFQQQAAEQWIRWMPRVYAAYRIIPPILRWAPAYHQAMYRISMEDGRRPAFSAWCWHHITRYINVPLALDPTSPHI
ncbi:MAG TPA: hypothetical protein DCF33_17825 [Saprospirales bacterium]|nr:hypothetical protein [Saprospirales bacterium]